MRLERAEIERDVGHGGRQDAAGGAARQIAFEGVPVGHAAAMLVDELAHGDSGRGELDAGVLHPSRNREGAKALAAVAPVRRERLRALLDDVAHPPQRLDIVDEGRAPEQADLARKRRLVARQPALALDRFQHRRFFAADIGAGAATEMELRAPRQAGRLELRDLAQQDLAALRILVTQIDVDVRRLDRPGADQHAFEEAVRVGLEIVPVLEGAGLALIGVDGHQARRRLGPHEAPLAPGGKARTAKPAQVRILERLDDALDRALAVEAIGEELIAALGAIAVEVDVARNVRMRLAGGDRLRDALDTRMLMQRMADRDDGRVVAAAHAGRADYAHVRFQ